MAKRYNEKKAKQAMAALDKELSTGQDRIDLGGTMKNDLKASAMGEGEELLYEKKLTKEEQKAAKKAAREAKKKAKVCFCDFVVKWWVIVDDEWLFVLCLLVYLFYELGSH